MKKIFSVILAVMLVFALCACSNNDGAKSVNQGSATVDDILQQQTSEDDGTQDSDELSSSIKKGEAGEVDVDLTVLNSTMVYSEVYNMLVSPDDYIGKTVKMHGSFAMYHDEVSDVYYFACIIADATACCSQGIEFVLNGDYSYPEDYPQLGTEITVVGTFSTYMEGTQQYCTLKNAQFVD